MSAVSASAAAPAADGNAGVLYDIALEADAAIEAAFDTWLRDQVADLLQFPGFLSAEILADASAPAGRVRRVVQCRLRDEPALAQFLAGHADGLDAQARAQFGDRFSVARRALLHREEFVRGASTENCLNCGEVLRGQHCAHCGQPATVRVLSLWGLLKDVLGDLLDWDARIWRTLRPLAFRPGWLTREYLRGRRARYTPPFRMYLILSLVFFVASSIGTDTGGDLELSRGGTERAGGGAESLPSPPGEAASPRPAAADLCAADQLRLDIGPLGDRYAPLLREACLKIAENSQGFGRALYQNVPKMMFIFLPLIAALMSVLYLGSRRYYVEHLLFLLHFHAFFFLGATALGLLQRLGTVSALAADAASLATAAFVIYTPCYLYRAMRCVYRQGRAVTLFKYALLLIGYLASMVVTALGLLAYTALTL